MSLARHSTEVTAPFSIAAVSALLNQPWAISEQGRQQVLSTVTYALQARDAMPLRATRRAWNRDGVAIIPVYGILTTRDSWWGCDYESILKDFTAALDDREVRAILFDLDTPGGLVAGAHDVAAAIFAARGKKPIAAFITNSCSAGYWIASACGRMVASPTALVGSIGCYASLVDDSELMKKIGIEVYNVANDQSPFKVLDPSKGGDRDRARVVVTQQASVFIADVAKGRGVSEDRVEAKFGKGDVLVGDAAKAVGMVDEIGDMESLIAELAKAPAPSAGSSASAVKRPTLAVVQTPKKTASKNVRAPRAEQKGKAMADTEKLKEHAKALHDAAQGDHESAGPMCEAMAPHMKALHDEMGEDSPFYKKDDDEDGDEAKAFVRELGGVKAARGVFAAMQKTAAIVEDLRKENAKAKADKEATEVKAMLDEAMADGRLNGAADRTAMEKDYAAHGIEFVRACLARLPKKAAPAREPASAPGAATPAPVVQAVAVATLTQAELALAQRRGIKPEDFAAFKAQYMTKLKGGVAAQEKE